jgi:hypothetical protein
MLAMNGRYLHPRKRTQLVSRIRIRNAKPDRVSLSNLLRLGYRLGLEKIILSKK